MDQAHLDTLRFDYDMATAHRISMCNNYEHILKQFFAEKATINALRATLGYVLEAQKRELEAKHQMIQFEEYING